MQRIRLQVSNQKASLDPLGSLWEIHQEVTGKSLESHWEVTGKSLGSHREVTGKSLGSHWEVTGKSLGSHREVTGKSQESKSVPSPFPQKEDPPQKPSILYRNRTRNGPLESWETSPESWETSPARAERHPQRELGDIP